LLTATDMARYPIAGGAPFGGMQRKLALACVLIHTPDLIFLAAPTTGVDPVSRREFWEILSQLHVQGITLVVSTPYMDEAEQCTRVALMMAGRLAVCDTPAHIKAMARELLALWPQDPHVPARHWRSCRNCRSATLRRPDPHPDGRRRRPHAGIRAAWPSAASPSTICGPGRVRMEEAFVYLTGTASSADPPARG
jgi:ABC-2 type transport system ATP-binding protein